MHNLALKCTCNSHSEPKLNVNAYDPTQTLTLRNQFAADIQKRFNELKRAIRKMIVDDDVFGLTKGAKTINTLAVTTPGRNAFAFAKSADKIKAFTDWLEHQSARGLLGTQSQVLRNIPGSYWTDKYIESAYRRGVTSARTKLRSAGYDIPPIDATGGIGIAMNQPFHADRVALLFARTFNDLKGISSTMSNQLSRVLAEGIARGENPNRIATMIIRTITGQSDLAVTDTLGRYISVERRAKMIARTEIIRAHADATLAEFKAWGVEGVVAKAEIRTAGDDRVCSICESLEGQTYSMEEAQGMIPVHVACRCAWYPKDVTKQ